MSADRKRSPAEIQAAFDDLFNSFSDKERLEQEGRMIGFAFLSEVEHAMDARPMTRKDLAKEMGISGSFLTQLFTGEKPLSDKHKAMFQRALGIRFVIHAQENASYGDEPVFHFQEVDRAAILRIVRDFKPDYAGDRSGRADYNENVAA
jgi:ribosome-binding protein aMBF1 (putative translation factor)